MRFAFIDAEKVQWSILVMCNVLGVSRSGYYVVRELRKQGMRVGEKRVELRKEASLAAKRSVSGKQLVRITPTRSRQTCSSETSSSNLPDTAWVTDVTRMRQSSNRASQASVISSSPMPRSSCRIAGCPLARIGARARPTAS